MFRIDAQGMYKGLQSALFAECVTLTDWLWMQMQGKAPPQVDRSQMEKEVVMVKDTIIGKISAGGLQALITEWGSGSLADESNPAWDDYVESVYYNPARFPYGHPISGRPPGSYVDLDNQEHTSSGAMEGLNLEGFLPPQEPLHWMREVMELSRPYILERFYQTVMMFPYQNYIYSA